MVDAMVAAGVTVVDATAVALAAVDVTAVAANIVATAGDNPAPTAADSRLLTAIAVGATVAAVANTGVITDLPGFRPSRPNPVARMALAPAKATTQPTAVRVKPAHVPTTNVTLMVVATVVQGSNLAASAAVADSLIVPTVTAAVPQGDADESPTTAITQFAGCVYHATGKSRLLAR
jgi:hypothetical protein